MKKQVKYALPVSQFSPREKPAETLRRQTVGRLSDMMGWKPPVVLSAKEIERLKGKQND
jgi:hypothetical protein